MTTMDITLLSLLGIQWTIAYFVGRWRYRNSSDDSPGLGFLWVPGIGLMLGFIIGMFMLIEFLGSDDFKERFYGRPKPNEPKMMHVSVSDLETMVNMYTCHGLISGSGSFSTVARVWRDTYASNTL